MQLQQALPTVHRVQLSDVDSDDDAELGLTSPPSYSFPGAADAAPREQQGNTGWTDNSRRSLGVGCVVLLGTMVVLALFVLLSPSEPVRDLETSLVRAASNGSLSFLVVGDWGRSGQESQVPQRSAARRAPR